MRMMWRGLELPGRVLLDKEVSDDSYGRFTIEPFEQGFGTTIGNSLRRVLLSSLEGAAVTVVKIEGVAHEFASIDGVVEDVTDILLNVKGIVVRYDSDEPATMSLKRDKAGEVRAGNIECPPGVEIVHPEHLIATLTASVPFHMEFKVVRGRGYATAVDNRSPEQELGVIPIDSIFTPILRVRFTTEAMRVGQRTNYDRLIIEVWTDGSVAPEDALVEASLILRKHLNPFVMYNELGVETVTRTSPAPVEIPSGVDSESEEFLNKPMSALNLSVRASNCLESAKITTLRELVVLTEAELLRFRSFGKTSLHEVHHKLAEVGLSLGMKLGDETASSGDVSVPSPTEVSRLGPLVETLSTPIMPNEVVPAPPMPAPPMPTPPASDGEAPPEPLEGTSPLGNSGHSPVSSSGDRLQSNAESGASVE